MTRHSLWACVALFAACSTPAAGGGVIDVDPEGYKQVFMGVGGSCGADGYVAAYRNLTSGQRQQIKQWVLDELPWHTLRAYRGYHNPYEYDARFTNLLWMFHDFQSHKPGIRFQMNFVEVRKMYQTQLEQYPNTPDEVLRNATQRYFEVLDYMHVHNAPVEEIDVLNEPGGGSKILAYGQLLAKPIDYLRQRLADPAQNPHGVQMPKVVGPSTWGTTGVHSYGTVLQKDLPEAWNNIDIASTHNYGDGTSVANFEAAAKMAGNRLFYNTESTGKPQPDDVLHDPTVYNALGSNYTAILVVAYKMCAALNGGVNEYYIFRNVGKPNNVPFVGITCGQEGEAGCAISRTELWYAYKHIAGLPPLNASVLSYTGSGYNSSYVWTVSLRKPGDSSVYVNVANLANATTPFQIGMKATAISSVKHLQTDVAGRRMEPMPPPVVSGASFNVSLAPYSLSTFVVSV